MNTLKLTPTKPSYLLQRKPKNGKKSKKISDVEEKLVKQIIGNENVYNIKNNKQFPTKYVLVVGGVLSGLGKGIITSSLGRIFKNLGFSVTAIKIDPYLNIDAGCLSPYEHGEVYVLADGSEVDLDLGNYERLMNIKLSGNNNITTGKVYYSVINKERKGSYLGKTVQVVPHITDEIQNRILEISNTPTLHDKKLPDVVFIELGGVVGDVEGMPYIEALRQFQNKVGKQNFIVGLTSLVPTISVVGEQKTKPTQQCCKELRGLGLFPDFIFCRSERKINQATKDKISMFCNVPNDHVIGVENVKNIFEIAPLLKKSNLHKNILKKFGFILEKEPHNKSSSSSPESETEDVETETGKFLCKIEKNFFKNWESIVESINKINNDNNDDNKVKIAIVGKYTKLSDCYLSIIKSIVHASLQTQKKVEIVWIESSDFEKNDNNKKEDEHQFDKKEKDENQFEKTKNILKNCDGAIIPGGFGYRGIEGKIKACQIIRENKIPYLGICLGFQIAIIEFCRNVLNIKDANSEEFLALEKGKNENDLTENEKENCVIVNMPEISTQVFGGTMRLGEKETKFLVDKCKKIKSQLWELYGKNEIINERHRHRFEVNLKFVEQLEKNGLMLIGRDLGGKRQEIFELDQNIHPYFVGVQYHPEYLSRVFAASPPFVGLIKNALKMKLEKKLKK